MGEDARCVFCKKPRGYVGILVEEGDIAICDTCVCRFSAKMGPKIVELNFTPRTLSGMSVEALNNIRAIFAQVEQGSQHVELELRRRKVKALDSKRDELRDVTRDMLRRAVRTITAIDISADDLEEKVAKVNAELDSAIDSCNNMMQDTYKR